jgi:hypothetical protein
MSKRGPNQTGFYKLKGGSVEDRDATKLSKQALVREAARLKRSGGERKVAAKRAVAQKAPKVELPQTPEVLARAHDREYARMNERRPRKRVKAAPVREQDYPSYLGSAARIVRRVARVALAPLALARAVVDRIRHHD